MSVRGEKSSPIPSGDVVSSFGPSASSDFSEVIPTKESLDLRGMVALVTGGSQGIGRAICSRLAHDGFRVIAADLQLSPSPKTPEEEVMLETGVTGRLVDVTKPSQLERLVAWIESNAGPIGVLVNNAGTLRVSPLLKLTEKDMREVFEVNFFGTFFCTQAVAARMVERRRGRIVNIASIAGKGGRPIFASYAASKAAVLNLTQSYALALAPYGITVNAVCPGIVRTNMWEQIDASLAALEGVPRQEPLRRRIAQIPLRRAESVEDVSNFVSYLVSPMGAYITGQRDQRRWRTGIPLMKFGLSIASYRWICYPPTPHDNQGATIFNVGHPAFLNLGLALPYTSSLRPPEPGQEVEWILDKTAELKLSPLYLASRLFATEEQARQAKESAEGKGIGLIGSGEADFAADAGEWKRDKERFVHQMRITKALGANLMAAVSSGALVHNHFTKDPPASEQIRRMVKHFRELVSHAEELGVVMALENHMDYRCTEIAEVIAQVDSPWLRVNFDFANSYSVIEDPLDAVRAVARWTVMAHIKDMRVQPKTLTGEPKVLWSPLGYGTVPVAEILEVLHAESPNPDNLPLCLEIAPLPDQDPDLWVKMSIGYMHQHLSKYLRPDTKQQRGLATEISPPKIVKEHKNAR